MNIRRRGNSWQVRVAGFKACSAPTREAAEKIALELKCRRALGDLFEEPSITLGEAIDGALARIDVTRSPAPRTSEYNRRCAKFWAPQRSERLTGLRRAKVEDPIHARAEKHPRSAKNELEFLKRVLHDAKGRGQRVDEAIFEIPAIKHRPRTGRALRVTELYELASWFPEHVSRMIVLGGQVGCRQNVLVSNLTDEMLDLKAGTVSIPAWLAKRRRDHRIYLTALEVKLLREQQLARPTGNNSRLSDDRRAPMDGKPLPRSRLALSGGSCREE